MASWEVVNSTSGLTALYYSLFASNKLPPLFGQNLAENHLDPEYRDEVGTEITDLTLLKGRRPFKRPSMV